MYLANYYLSWLLILPVLVWLFFFWQKKEEQKYLSGIGEPGTVKNMINYSEKKARLKKWFLIIGIFFLILALLRPQWGLKKEKIAKKGLDMIIALDISASMQTEDILPSRLDKSMLEIRKLLSKLSGDRVGLITFAGSATAVCPLTSDYGAIEMFLKSLKYYKEPVPGTNIPAAFERALEMYDFKAAQDKLFLIFTDGENHEGDLKSVKNQAEDKGIVVVPIAVGTKGGQPVPNYDESGQRTGYKKDKKGEVVISHVDYKSLKSLATIGPYAIDSNKQSIVNIIDDFKNFKRAKFKELKIDIYAERYQIFLLIGLVFLLAGYLLSDYQEKIYK